MVLAFRVIHCEAVRERLLIPRVRLGWCMWLACLLLGLSADDVFCARQGEQVAQFGRVEKVRSRQHQLAAALDVAHAYVRALGPGPLPQRRAGVA